jgi:hypothetical protein
VHQRLTLTAGGPAQKQITGALGDMVKPGAWIQLIEASNEEHESHGSAFRNFVTVIKSIYIVFQESLKLVENIPASEETQLRGCAASRHRYEARSSASEAATRNAGRLVDYHRCEESIPLCVKSSLHTPVFSTATVHSYRSTALLQESVLLTTERIANNADELNAELAESGTVYPL